MATQVIGKGKGCFNGVWLEFDLLLRDGKFCGCGPQHGVFPRCVGSETQDKSRPARRRVPRERRQPAEVWFPVPAGRLPREVPADEVAACDDCGPYHEAFRYCVAHRRQAVRNVRLANRRRHDVTSLHLMLADHGFDIVS